MFSFDAKDDREKIVSRISDVAEMSGTWECLGLAAWAVLNMALVRSADFPPNADHIARPVRTVDAPLNR